MIQEKLTVLRLPYKGGDDRTVRVYVPAHDEGERLPVIYMTDGQNLFEDGKPGQFGCWYTREAVAAERAGSGRAAIIVGVHNDGSPMERTNELTPGSIGRLYYPPGLPRELREALIPEGELFDGFIVNTVMPAVEAAFPVGAGRENTAFCGSSSGGLQAAFTALTHPDIFGFAGVFSPAFLLYEPEDFARWLTGKLGCDMPFLYMYSGDDGDMEKEICRCTESACDILAEYCPPEHYIRDIRRGLPHSETAWEPVFRDFLRIFLNK